MVQMQLNDYKDEEVSVKGGTRAAGGVRVVN